VGYKFSDESTFSSAHDGPDLVFRSWGEHYNCQYMSTSKRSGHVSIQFWDCISHERPGMLHRLRHLDSLQYENILQNAMVPSVQMFYLNGIIQFQQDHSYIHDSRLVQGWLSLQADVELIDWPPQVPDRTLT